MRAQISMEFLLLLGVAVLMFSGVIAYVTIERIELERTTNERLLEDLAYSLQQEISIASTMHDGYERDFTVPDDINNRNYQIRLGDRMLELSQDNTLFIVPIPVVSGAIDHGEMTIRNDEGEVILIP